MCKSAHFSRSSFPSFLNTLCYVVEKDTSKGMGAGWERFEFNKDAPLDEGEEMEGECTFLCLTVFSGVHSICCLIAQSLGCFG